METAEDKSRAEAVASRARGVRLVENHLSVRPPWVKKSDEEIKREIERIWRDNQFMYETAVAVKDGIATLTGEVDTREMRYVLGQMAAEGGAKRVRNHMKVRLENGERLPGYPSRTGRARGQVAVMTRHPL